MTAQQHEISRMAQVMTIPSAHLYKEVDVIGLYLEGLHLNQETNAVRLINPNQFDSLTDLAMEVASVKRKGYSGRRKKRSFHQLPKKKMKTDRAKNPRSTSHRHVMLKKRNRLSKRIRQARRSKHLNEILMREFGLRLPAASFQSPRMDNQSTATEHTHVNPRKRCYPYNKFFVTGRPMNSSEPSQSKKMKPSTRTRRPPTFVTTRKSFHNRLICRTVFRARTCPLVSSSSSIIKTQ